jgi:hypothetical protein
LLVAARVTGPTAASIGPMADFFGCGFYHHAKPLKS